MFLFEHHWYLAYLIKVSKLSTGALFSWDNESKKVTGPKYIFRAHILARFKLLIVLVNILVLLAQDFYFKHQSENEKSSADEVALVAILQNCCLSLVLLITLNVHSSIIPAYINGHLDFKNIFNREQKIAPTVLEKLNIAFAYSAGFMTFPFVVVFLYAIHWYSPCKPSLPGYWLLMECGSRDSLWNEWLIPIKPILFASNHLILQMSMSSFPICCAAFLVFGTLSFRNYMISYKQMCKLEGFLNVKTITIYRRIQVLSIYMNEIQRWGLTGNGAISVVLVFTFNLTGLVRALGKSADPVMISFFLFLIGCACVWNSAGLGAQANIHTTSLEVLQDLRQCCRANRCMHGKWLQTFYRSCSTVKVGLGSINFIERSTPLTILSYSVDCTVNFLLLE